MAADIFAPLAPLAPLAEPSSSGMAAAIEPASTSELPLPAAGTAPSTDRTIDGTDNNLVHPEWGSTLQQLRRVGPAEYGDGVSTLAGANRPNPRHISNSLLAQQPVTANERSLSALVYIWGQFLDHDIDHTGTDAAGTESVPIPVPSGDPQFDPNGTGTQSIAFTRAIFDPKTGTSPANPRQQLNQITAWIDGSMIYGSDQATADSLRTFQSGQLRTSSGSLPTEENGEFVAGDVRASENIELTAMHTLFIREHNRLAAEMATANPTWTDERIYQEARALVYAKIQVITYKEFLPALLGVSALEPYRGYDPTVDPSIANEFSTAAYRLHTMVNDDVEFFDNDGRPMRDGITLAEAFHNSALLKQTGIDPLLKYAASTQAQEVDTQIVDGLRNFLFGQPGQGGLDLASLNIQRGRDHGLADYNAVRQAYGLAAVTGFSDITSNEQVAATLQQLYGTVADIDLWVGIIAEDHVAGGSLGELGTTIIADQFQRLRDGDRFWYQNIFSGSALAYLEQTTLSDVIQQNTNISNLQGNVFIMQSEILGKVYTDTNGNGRQDVGESQLAGVNVELLNSEGQVIANSRTDSNGQYFFRITETGDYQVRAVLRSRLVVAPPPRNILISRGEHTIEDFDFRLQEARMTRRTQFASIDAAFESMGSAAAIVDDLDQVTRKRKSLDRQH